MNTTKAVIGTVYEYTRGGFAVVDRAQSDAFDHTRCAYCDKVIGYAPRGKRFADDAAVHCYKH